MVWVYNEITALWTQVNINTITIEQMQQTLNLHDIEIFALQDAVLLLQTQVASLQTTTVSLQTQISKNDGEITLLEGRCDTLEGNVLTLDGRCDDLDDDVVDLNERCDTLGDRCTALEDNLELFTQQVTYNGTITCTGTGDYDFTFSGAVGAATFLRPFQGSQYVERVSQGKYRVVFLLGVYSTGLGAKLIVKGAGNTKDPVGHDDWVFVTTGESGAYYSQGNLVGYYANFVLCRPDGIFNLDNGGYVNVEFSVNYGVPSFV